MQIICLWVCVPSEIIYALITASGADENGNLDCSPIDEVEIEEEEESANHSPLPSFEYQNRQTTCPILLSPDWEYELDSAHFHPRSRRKTIKIKCASVPSACLCFNYLYLRWSMKRRGSGMKRSRIVRCVLEKGAY